ncbi:MAG: Peptidoglycan D,D-transpeptidase MrdA [Chlamydiia bacterium]|nr:Peptidoglycan D,D-transpeptidase MrdA [Chlamydiia bacterium]MCH9616240.1 Peptidoglycan D,D-transpeptidase MrdA [Chlamydiia bacterium]MCH9629774.1 Peptidoglycan D,D-transpeptidase MrdA [Chlamydiia bacterium]
MIISKVSRTLNLILLALLLIGVRITFLTTKEYEKYRILSEKPRTRTLLERPYRGVITDRFGQPLALNRLQYNASILYQPLREMSRSKRRAYIPKLVQVLSKELDLPSQEVEDAIYAKASLFPNTPCVLKGNINENVYYRLRHLERSFPGIVCERGTRRVYPQGRTACDIVGTMGAISDRKYLAVANELKAVRAFLQEREDGIPTPLPKGFNALSEVHHRLKVLRDKAYTMHTHIGKGGIEGRFEEALRGQIGRRICEVDTKGRVVREIKRLQDANSGETIKLTLSSEMQAFAEKLLMENELVREKHFSRAGKNHDKIPNPWIKGGAIVAMIPTTGEIVTLASYPRFDPNSFIDKDFPQISRFLESKHHISQLWDGKVFLEKETPKKVISKKLTWEVFIDSVISPKSELKRTMSQIRTIGQTIEIERGVKTLLNLSEQPYLHALFDTLYPNHPSHFHTGALEQAAIRASLSEHKEHVFELRSLLDPLFHAVTENDDKLLLIDLLYLVVDESKFTPELLAAHKNLSLGLYREYCQDTALHLAKAKREMHRVFEKEVFPLWREKHFAAFLKEKRKLEKKWQRPYTDYLEEAKKAGFERYFEEHINEYLTPFMLTVRQYKDQTRMLHRYPKLCEKDLIAQFYPSNGFGYGNSYAYKQHAPPGSLFKIITGFEALRQTGSTFNPLTLFDEGAPNKQLLGRSLEGKPIYRRYKGGRLPRSHTAIGRVDFRRAMQRSSNIYFSLLAGDILEEGEDLKRAAEDWGFGEKTGIELGMEAPGLLPKDLRGNKSALYSFAIGQHKAAATPLQTAYMLATLANNGEKIAPHILQKPPTTVGRIDAPTELFSYMRDILKSVVAAPEGAVHPTRIRMLYENPKIRPIYKKVYRSLGGKTSTTEFSRRPCLNKDCPRVICKDIWFGGFTDDLVVVVYLRYGDWGKEAAPLAALMIDKWNQITKEK